MKQLQLAECKTARCICYPHSLQFFYSWSYYFGIESTNTRDFLIFSFFLFFSARRTIFSVFFPRRQVTSILRRFHFLKRSVIRTLRVRPASLTFIARCKPDFCAGEPSRTASGAFVGRIAYSNCSELHIKPLRPPIIPTFCTA